MRFEIRGVPAEVSPGIYPSRIGAHEIDAETGRVVIPVFWAPERAGRRSLYPITVGLD